MTVSERLCQIVRLNARTPEGRNDILRAICERDDEMRGHVARIGLNALALGVMLGAIAGALVMR